MTNSRKRLFPTERLFDMSRKLFPENTQRNLKSDELLHLISKHSEKINNRLFKRYFRKIRNARNQSGNLTVAPGPTLERPRSAGSTASSASRRSSPPPPKQQPSNVRTLGFRPPKRWSRVGESSKRPRVAMRENDRRTGRLRMFKGFMKSSLSRRIELFRIGFYQVTHKSNFSTRYMCLKLVRVQKINIH